MMPESPAGWRSLLFVPVTSERFLASALRGDADAIQLDLEDSIPADAKDTAREVVGGAIDRIAAGHRDAVVRVNRPMRQLVRDLEAVARKGLTAVTLPKVEDAAFITEIDAILAELELERGLQPRSIRLIAMIETARGLKNAFDIAASSDRLSALTIGPEDLSVSLGCAVNEDSMFQPAMTVLTAARSAGKIPLGYVGSISEYSDLNKYRQWIVRARQLGFEGAFCVHPNQVAILNQEFLPTAEEVEYATALVEAFERNAADGKAAFSFRGTMIDGPVAGRARQIMQRASRAVPAST